jgi:lipoprotein-anchoring transpeptidase ErfK/SrfK
MKHRLVLLAVAVCALAGCAAEAQPLARPAAMTAPPSTTTTTTTPEPEPPPCEPGIRACVRLSTKQAWLVTNGVADLGPVPIAHGGTASPTPTGTFPVAWKDAEHTSSIYGDPMPFSVFFAPGGIAFHEGDLATDSHGCVRLDQARAQTFFASLNPGDLVQVLP